MKNAILVLISLVFAYLAYNPTNASAEVCGVFQKKVSGVCVHFDVPPNAHLTYSGNSWDCNRGFKRSADNNSCEEVKIPSNAEGNLIGSFYCNSGFEKLGNECQKVADVENGKFYVYGSNFYCLVGFKRKEETETCEKILIPANAREDDSSLDGWNCFSGYIKEGNACKEFQLPEHGFWFIDYWGCEPGFKKNTGAKSCDKISIPENAYATGTFDGWLCNPGYSKNYKENHCDKQ